MAIRLRHLLSIFDSSRILVLRHTSISKKTPGLNFSLLPNPVRMREIIIVNLDNAQNKQTRKLRCLKTRCLQLHVFMGSLFGVFSRQSKKDTSEWDGEKEVVHNITLAQMALNDGDVEKAEKILESAVQVANDKQVKVGVACVYDMLATIAYKQGKINKAETLLIEIINTLIISGIPQNDNQIVNFSLKLCRIYWNLKEEELAELGFRNCLSTQRQKIAHGIKDEETGMLWISILFWYGKFLLMKNRLEEAKTCFEAAYAASAQVKHIMPAQIMVILYNLSEISMVKHDYDNALKHLLNAVILGKGCSNDDLPTYYVKIGLVYMHKGIYDQAKIWCGRAKKSSKICRNQDAEKEANDCLEKLSTISFA